MVKLDKSIIVSGMEKNADDIRKFGVKRIGLFGSFLGRKQTSKSDVDILVTFDNVTFRRYIGLLQYLEKLFNKKVDLVNEKFLREELNYVKDEAVYARL